MTKGWVALHRKTMESLVWTDPVLYRFWSLCLMVANHKANPKYIFNGLPAPIDAGQFITGREVLTELYNKGLKKKDKISESTAWRLLKKLENMEMLNIKSTTKYSVISITNWNMYQGFEQQSEQQLNNKPTTSEQQTDTNNNVNNNNNKKNVLGTNRDINSKYQNACDMYRRAYPEKPINEFIAQSIAAWINDFNGHEEIVSYAIEQAGQNAASTPKYFETILKAWEKLGITSIEQARAHTERFEAKRDQELAEKLKMQQQDLQAYEESQKPIPKVTLHNWLTQEDEV